MTVKVEQEDKDGVTQATIQTQTSLKKYFFKKLQQQKRQRFALRALGLWGGFRGGSQSVHDVTVAEE